MGIGGGTLTPMVDGEIAQLEKELECQFPDDYRFFC